VVNVCGKRRSVEGGMLGGLIVTSAVLHMCKREFGSARSIVVSLIASVLFLAPDVGAQDPNRRSQPKLYEMSRRVTAENFRSAYCRYWDDGCTACRIEEQGATTCIPLGERAAGRQCTRQDVSCWVPNYVAPEVCELMVMLLPEFYRDMSPDLLDATDQQKIDANWRTGKAPKFVLAPDEPAGVQVSRRRVIRSAAVPLSYGFGGHGEHVGPSFDLKPNLTAWENVVAHVRQHYGVALPRRRTLYCLKFSLAPQLPNK
jgi:hypothetical protein